MKKVTLAILAYSLIIVVIGVAYAGSYQVTQGSGTVFATIVNGSSQNIPIVGIGDGTAAANLAAVTPSNALKVDGSAVTQPISGTVTTSPPSNASTNVSQFGGNNVATGTGASGVGIPRVTVSNDSVVGLASGSNTVGTVNLNEDGSAAGGTAASKSALAGCQYNATPPTLTNGQQAACQSNANGAIQVTGGVTDGSSATGALYSAVAGRGSTGIQKIVTCDSYAKYDASTSGDTQIIAASGSTKIYVCGYSIHTGGTATNVKLDYGTGTNCGTGGTALTPAWQLLANAGRVEDSPFWNGLATPASQALCVNASAANAVQAEVWYAQF